MVHQQQTSGSFSFTGNNATYGTDSISSLQSSNQDDNMSIEYLTHVLTNVNRRRTKIPPSPTSFDHHHSYKMPPATTTETSRLPPSQTTTMGYHQVSIEEGAWKGVMTFPRAVSHDQSDDMDTTVSGNHGQSCSCSTSHNDNSTFTDQLSSSMTTCVRDKKVLPTGSAKEQQLHLQRYATVNPSSLMNDMSALTLRSSSTMDSSVVPMNHQFSNMGRYTAAPPIQEHGGEEIEELDDDGTAYYSVAALAAMGERQQYSPAHHRLDHRQNNAPQALFTIGTSTAISSSPSPMRPPRDSHSNGNTIRVGDINETTSLTPEREYQHCTQDSNRRINTTTVSKSSNFSIIPKHDESHRNLITIAEGLATTRHTAFSLKQQPLRPFSLVSSFSLFNGKGTNTQSLQTPSPALQQSSTILLDSSTIQETISSASHLSSQHHFGNKDEENPVYLNDSQTAKNGHQHVFFWRDNHSATNTKTIALPQDPSSLSPGKDGQSSSSQSKDETQSRGEDGEYVWTRQTTTQSSLPPEHAISLVLQGSKTTNSSSESKGGSMLQRSHSYGQLSSVQQKLSSWRVNSILDSKEDLNESSSSTGKDGRADNTSATKSSTKIETRSQPSKESLASGNSAATSKDSYTPLVRKSLLPSATKEAHPQDPDPLYQLQRLSTTTTQTRGSGQQDAIFSPLQESTATGMSGYTMLLPPPEASQCSVGHISSLKLSLAHYLSSSSSCESLSVGDATSKPEPREEADTTFLSGIDVLKPTKMSSSEANSPLVHAEGGSNNASTNSSGVENIIISAPSLQSLEQPSETAQPKEAVLTPPKSDLHLDPKDFDSPNTALRKKSMHISLEESSAYFARIGELEANLKMAKDAIEEQKSLYEQQMAKQYEFMIPFQPHSPFGAEKHSPSTQKLRLLERNQTLLKEIRFADQSCVELSQQKAALKGKLQLREKELEEMCQMQQEVTQKYLESKRESATAEVSPKELEKANEDKCALVERQLHAAFAKLDYQAKRLKVLREEHAIELKAAFRSGANQNTRKIDDLRFAPDLNKQHKQALEVKERERDDLSLQVDESSAYRTSYRTAFSDGNNVNDKVTQLAALETANLDLASTHQDLERTRLELLAAGKERKSYPWMTEENEQVLRQLKDKNDLIVAKYGHLKEQADQCRSQADALQNEDKFYPPQQHHSNNVGGDIAAASHGILVQAHETEKKFRQAEFDFSKKVESDMIDLNRAIFSLTEKSKNVECQGTPDAAELKTKINPSFLSHLLSTKFANGGGLLSPEIIQVLQLIHMFTQQHWDFVDHKIGNLTTLYGERLVKLQKLLTHIRSSLVFESESDQESLVGCKVDTDENNRMLDATFAVVTSIPDQKVKLMEEARSEEQMARKCAHSTVPHSSARVTILDLSRIEATNSPICQINTAFSIDGGDDAAAPPSRPTVGEIGTKKERLQVAQRSVFREPLDSGKQELEIFRKVLLSLQKDFVLHHDRMGTFVGTQQKAMQQVNDKLCSSASHETLKMNYTTTSEKLATALEQLRVAAEEKERGANEIMYLKSELHSREDSHETLKMTYTHTNEKLANALERLEQLEAVAQARESLNSELQTTQEELECNLDEMLTPLNLAHEAIRKVKGSTVAMLKEKENALKHVRQESMALRSENADRIKINQSCIVEIDRLGEALKTSETALEDVKVSYADCNNKLSAALEKASNRDEIADMLRLSQEAEGPLREEIASIKEEQEILMGMLRDAKKEVEDGHKAVSSLEKLAAEKAGMRESIEATRLQLEEIISHLGSDLKNTQAKLMRSIEEIQHLRNELMEMTQQKDTCETEIDFLSFSRLQLEGNMEKLKDLHASCNDRLAEVQNCNASNQALLEQLEAACEAAESLKESTEERLLECQNELEKTRKERDQLLCEIDEAKEHLLRVDQLREEKENIAVSSTVELSALAADLRSLRGGLEKSLSFLNGRSAAATHVADVCNAMEEIQQLKVVSSSLCQSVVTLINKVEISGQQTQRLRKEGVHFQTIEADLRGSLQDEKFVSQELASQLQHARSQAECSSSKTNKLLTALGEARSREANERRKAICEAAWQESKLVTCENELKTMEQALVELKWQKNSAEKRCLKLREYMRKLTAKCEEWETCYAQQNKLLGSLHAQHEQTKARAVTHKYSEFTGDLQIRAKLQEDARDRHVGDLPNSRSVHDQLEDNLNQIAMHLQQNLSWS